MNTMNTDTIEQKRAGLLASWLGCEADDVRQVGYQHYGLTVYSTPDGEFAVGDDLQCDLAVRSYIESCVWALNAEFVLKCCDLPLELTDAIRSFQSKQCEDANDALLALVNKTCGIERFTDRAIDADGRGHFLASFDGDENELLGSVFAYRVC